MRGAHSIGERSSPRNPEIRRGNPFFMQCSVKAAVGRPRVSRRPEPAPPAIGRAREGSAGWGGRRPRIPGRSRRHETPPQTGVKPCTRRSRRTTAAAVAVILLAVLGASQIGCSAWPASWGTPSVSRIFAPQPAIANPLVVPSSDYETVWKKCVAVVNQYFPIASENRLAGIIRTDSPLTGSLLEPWSPDSVGFRDRLEATLQTIRKFALIHIDPAPTGGYLVKVEVFKELEDLSKPDRQPAGRAVFYNDFPVNRTREIVGPVPAPLGWIRQGRDTNLEQAILAGIRDALLL